MARNPIPRIGSFGKTPTKKEERNTFLFLTIFLAPFITVACIGGYGFLIWMAQLIFGPPSH